MRNRYIEYSVWNTAYDPDERYAGCEYAMQSNGSDDLGTWAEDDQMLMGQDQVIWSTADFIHIPRMEDWSVMTTDWKTVHIMPHIYFATNPAMTLHNEN